MEFKYSVRLDIVSPDLDLGKISGKLEAAFPTPVTEGMTVTVPISSKNGEQLVIGEVIGRIRNFARCESDNGFVSAFSMRAIYPTDQFEIARDALTPNGSGEYGFMYHAD